MKNKYIITLCTIRKFVSFLKAILSLALLALEVVRKFKDLLE